MDLRVEDVRNRRDTIAILKYEREQAVAEDKGRSEKREAALEEKQTVSNNPCLSFKSTATILWL